MPRKANEELIEVKKATKKSTTGSTNASKVVSKKTATKSGTSKINTQKSNTTKNSTKKTASKKANTVSTTTDSKTTARKKSTVKTSTSTRSKKKLPVVEYYDLPNLYNQTIVKILAQTPSVLFVYWDISVEDKNAYLEKYGDDFFNNTIPYLSVTNKTKDYTFEVEINDYANSWYININDADCKYDVVLFRKPKNFEANLKQTINENIYIASSNDLQTPNDHILFDSLGKTVFFKNIKTNEVEIRNTSSLSFMNNIGRIYNIYDLYKEIYKNELTENRLDAHLTSSKM